jgi:hypothetical protein
MFKKYFLPDFDKSNFDLIYTGQRKRHATATAVSFINDKLLICASFLNREIYLFDIELGEIICKIKSNYYIDLLDYKNNLIVTINNTYKKLPSSISIFSVDIENKKIIFIKDIILKPSEIETHGIRILDSNTVIITCTNNKNRGILFYDIKNCKDLKLFNNFKFKPKDIFIQENKNLLYILTSSTSPGYAKFQVKESCIYVYEYSSLKLIDELCFIGQTDCLTILEKELTTYGFITLQDGDSLYHFKFEKNKLEFIDKIPGFNFPHGIASLNNKIAVSNYGDNSIQLFDF